ncbi:hypothetical protein RIF29_19098 [Crotalaria pallida]|uniref:BIG2 domain-containing protein n=1 Tax=Crotalaria pallida TaxID=3830 RepID=A0AAN9I674_CROPI
MYYPLYTLFPLIEIGDSHTMFRLKTASKAVLFNVMDLAVGAELDLPTSFYDALGNPFYEAYNAVPFFAETNYPDVLGINRTADGKGNVHIKAIRHGKALVPVSISEAPQKYDYVLVRVGAHVYPQNPVLRIGSPLNFSINGLNDKVSGQWFSTNGSVVSVDKLSGMAKAVGEPTRHGKSKLQTTVTVLKGDTISVDALKESESLAAPGGSQRVSFDCRVDPPYAGYVKPWMDLDFDDSLPIFPLLTGAFGARYLS